MASAPGASLAPAFPLRSRLEHYVLAYLKHVLATIDGDLARHGPFVGSVVSRLAAFGTLHLRVSALEAARTAVETLERSARGLDDIALPVYVGLAAVKQVLDLPDRIDAFIRAIAPEIAAGSYVTPRDRWRAATIIAVQDGCRIGPSDMERQFARLLWERLDANPDRICLFEAGRGGTRIEDGFDLLGCRVTRPNAVGFRRAASIASLMMAALTLALVMAVTLAGPWFRRRPSDASMPPAAVSTPETGVVTPAPAADTRPPRTPPRPMPSPASAEAGAPPAGPGPAPEAAPGPPPSPVPPAPATAPSVPPGAAGGTEVTLPPSVPGGLPVRFRINVYAVPGGMPCPPPGCVALPAAAVSTIAGDILLAPGRRLVAVVNDRDVFLPEGSRGTIDVEFPLLLRGRMNVVSIRTDPVDQQYDYGRLEVRWLVP